MAQTDVIWRPPARRGKNTPARRLAVLLFVLSPLAVLTVLCVWMYFAIQVPPQMSEPPKGAGAGKTGLGNEYTSFGKGRPEAKPAATPAPK
jgi:hypothetical protein